MDETMIAQQLERVNQRCKSNTHRLDEMDKRQDNILYGSYWVIGDKI